MNFGQGWVFDESIKLKTVNMTRICFERPPLCYFGANKANNKSVVQKLTSITVCPFLCTKWTVHVSDHEYMNHWNILEN